jgi:trk system potassium uptake protein TrkA
MEAPPQFVGKTLKELELRRRFDMQVILVKRREEDKGLTKIKREMPGPDFEIRKNDLMLPLGSAANMKKITSL